jgi:DNA-binding NarL/FixJ family response regulator
MPDPTDTAPQLAFPPVGLLVGRDLFFNSKITGTAQALGSHVMVAATREKALERLATVTPRVIFLDLAAGDACSPLSISAYRAAAPHAAFLAFGSHVDTASLEAARDAGCDDVMPRSKLTATLPDLIRRYLG